MNIAFSGHRDRNVTPQELEQIASRYPDATWIHGGAQGFDSQVAEFARTYAIPQVVIRPDYTSRGKAAPLIRNREIVDRCDLVCACYDGRKTGGTAYTVRYARSKGKPVAILSPVQYQEVTLAPR